jgi:hypothetical protein
MGKKKNNSRTAADAVVVQARSVSGDVIVNGDHKGGIRKTFR